MVRSDRELIVLESTERGPIQGAKTQRSIWTIETCRAITGIARTGGTSAIGNRENSPRARRTRRCEQARRTIARNPRSSP